MMVGGGGSSDGCWTSNERTNERTVFNTDFVNRYNTGNDISGGSLVVVIWCVYSALFSSTAVCASGNNEPLC